MSCHGRHGGVRGGVVLGRGGTRPCLGRARDGVAHAGAVGRLRGVLVGRGGRGACVHAVCSTVGLAGRSPAIAARGGGPGARARHGRPQDGKWQLQGMVVRGFGAGLLNGPSGGHVHGGVA